MQPSTSVLFANMSRLAPASRCSLSVSLLSLGRKWQTVPLPVAARVARLCSLQCVAGPSRRQPRSAHLSSQSSSSSTTAASSAHRRPLYTVSNRLCLSAQFLTYVEFVPVRIVSNVGSTSDVGSSPAVFNRLDDEPQRRAHRVDVLPHDLLHNRCLSRVIQASAQYLAHDRSRPPNNSQH